MFKNKKCFFVLVIVTLAFLFGGVLDIAAAEKKHIIMIDAAHGGSDKGVKLDNNVTEKNVTLAVALLLKKELSQEKNIEVILTRDSDKNIDLEDRRKIIEKIKPDFLLSLHVNSGFGKHADGFEIYYPELIEDTKSDGKPAKDEKTKLQNKFQSDSLKMAKNVQENLNILFPRKGRGLRKAVAPLTDGMIIPMLSVEMSFATNSEDKEKLLSQKMQADLSKSLAKSIKTFFR